MNTDPLYYGLSSRTKLVVIGDKHLGIVKRIKSRIIQKDALKIIELAKRMTQKASHIKVSLICNDNICSKSIQLLKTHNIEVIF